MRREIWCVGDFRKASAEANGCLAEENEVIENTNFDRYRKQQVKDPAFAARFEEACDVWDVSIQHEKRVQSTNFGVRSTELRPSALNLAGPKAKLFVL